MNYKMVIKLSGKIFLVEAVLLLLPLLIALLYREDTVTAFLIPFLILLFLGGTSHLVFAKQKFNETIYAKEGFVVVALAWVLTSFVGAIPFTISGAIPSYLDSLFETVSGFTTTGATILADVESLPYSILFWRSFTHWIGGMGVLVLLLALLPQSEMRSMHLLRAEVPGPTVGKIVSRIHVTARILYGIYIALTFLEVLLLLFGGMPLFDSLLHSFGTAGTGGFSLKNASIGAYGSSYFEIVISIFMLLFGINFNLFYLLLIGNWRRVWRSGELRCYLGLVCSSVVLIGMNIYPLYQNVWTSFRLSLFQVSSIVTTTGYATVDYNIWPEFSRTMLVLLMFVGSCAGSTAGGLKVSRVMIMVKNIFQEVKQMIHPKSVLAIKQDGEIVDQIVVKRVNSYFATYSILFALSLLLLSFDRFDGVTNFTAVAACINNVGPGLELVGPIGNYGAFSGLSKVVFIFDMLLGRLEIFPILILFHPGTWKSR